MTDKQADSKIVHKALRLCIDDIMQLAEKMNCKLVYTATKEPGLQKRYQKFHKMILAESDVKTFLRDLDGKYSNDLTWISDDEQIEMHNK